MTVSPNNRTLAPRPSSTIAFAILAVFPVFEGAREEIQAFVFDNFVPDTGERLAEHFDGFVDNAGGLTTVGIGHRPNGLCRETWSPLR